MITLATDTSNDLYLDAQGYIAVASDLQAVLQNCEHAVKTMLGECVLDQQRGLPNFTVIWNGNPNVNQYDAALRKTIRAVSGVVDIRSLNVRLSGEKLIYNAVIKTIYGTGELTNGL